MIYHENLVLFKVDDPVRDIGEVGVRIVFSKSCF